MILLKVKLKINHFLRMFRTLRIFRKLELGIAFVRVFGKKKTPHVIYFRIFLDQTRKFRAV